MPAADWTLLVAVVLMVFAVVAWLLRPRTVAVIGIDRGGVAVRRGSPPAAFVADVERICRLWGITSGTLRLTRSGRALRVRATGEAGEYRQAFQNALQYPV